MHTRLQILCNLHGQQGGTIADFNKRYNLDFISMNDTAWNTFRSFLLQHLLKNAAKPVKVWLGDWEPSFTQTETDKFGQSEEYTYPEMRNVTIEAWSTHKYSETKDGRLIREGCDLSGKGILLDALVQRILNEQQSFSDYCYFNK